MLEDYVTPMQWNLAMPGTRDLRKYICCIMRKKGYIPVQHCYEKDYWYSTVAKKGIYWYNTIAKNVIY